MAKVSRARRQFSRVVGWILFIVGLCYLPSDIAGIFDWVGKSAPELSWLRSAPSWRWVSPALVLFGGSAFLIPWFIERREKKKGSSSTDDQPLRGVHFRGDLSLLTIPGPDGPTMPILAFKTQGRQNALEGTRSRPRALRFILPLEAEGRTVREGDLPAEIQSGAGNLIVKRFTDSGVIVDEHGTKGEEIRAEVYYESRLRHESSTEWVIRHDWGLRPNVRVLDAEGNEVVADVNQRSADTTVIRFGQPQSGVSVCIESRHMIEAFLDAPNDEWLHESPSQATTSHDTPTSPDRLRNPIPEETQRLEGLKQELVDQVYPPSLKELLQRKLDEGYKLLENVPSWLGDVSKAFSGVPTTTEAHVDNWAFQVEALLKEDPRRLAIFRISRPPYDALKTLAGITGNPLRERLEHELHQLEEVIRGLP